MGEPLICLECRNGLLQGEPRDAHDFDYDITCRNCGHVYHGFQDYIDEQARQHGLEVLEETEESN